VRARPALAVLLCGFLGAVVPAAAEKLPGSWVETRSEHFLVLGNVPEKKTQEIAREFERIRRFLGQRIPAAVPEGGPPLRIYVARDEATMKILMPSLVQALGSGTVGGRFVDQPTGQFIQLRAGNGSEWDLQVVFHEYFHYLVNRLDLDLPLWLEEGLADFWGATQFRREATEIGRLIPGRMKQLVLPTLPPLERLLVLDRSSPEYRDRQRIGSVYAESWALVHFLVLGDKSARSDQLSRYIQLVAGGRESLAAAREAFGDLDKLAREFKGYRGGKLFPLGKMAPVPDAGAAAHPARAVSDPEAAARIVIAQFHTEPTAAMAPWAAVAASAGTPNGATELAAALFALREQRLTDSTAAFARAAAAGAPEAAEALTWYGLAVLEQHERDGDSTPAGLDRAEERLRRALAFDAGFAAAHSRLAEIHLQRGTDLAAALAEIRLALRLRPDDDFFTVREIQLIDRIGGHAEARARVARLVADALASGSALYLNDLCWQGTLVGYGRAFLPLCEKAVELSPSASHLDSRGVARGVTGDVAGAAADIAAALAVRESNFTPEVKAMREDWLSSLRRNENPFTPELLLELLQGPSAGVRWGR
jgi:tetratricopeptide (TPR) repeat protein